MEKGGDLPRLYEDLSWIWPLWGSPDDYAPWCRHVMDCFQSHAERTLTTVLNLGCGGGKNLFHLKRHFKATGLDRSKSMLDLARNLNPECQLLQADMRDFTLNSTFDAILIDDAVGYMRTEKDLSRLFQSAYKHLASGGVLVVSPDETKETFIQNKTRVSSGLENSAHESPELIFIENDYDPDPSDTEYEGLIVYIIRSEGRLSIETDLHRMGLFHQETWERLLLQTGFRIFRSAYTEEVKKHTVFTCLKPKNSKS
ncbi:class I SAM-dependent methyltransferase [bacterium]|nr:class I SAM-dependent methyltransferase [candidate division CSSED10-310 bacterium]